MADAEDWSGFSHMSRWSCSAPSRVGEQISLVPTGRRRFHAIYNHRVYKSIKNGQLGPPTPRTLLLLPGRPATCRWEAFHRNALLGSQCLIVEDILGSPNAFQRLTVPRKSSSRGIYHVGLSGIPAAASLRWANRFFVTVLKTAIRWLHSRSSCRHGPGNPTHVLKII